MAEHSRRYTTCCGVNHFLQRNVDSVVAWANSDLITNCSTELPEQLHAINLRLGYDVSEEVLNNRPPYSLLITFPNPDQPQNPEDQEQPNAAVVDHWLLHRLRHITPNSHWANSMQNEPIDLTRSGSRER